MIYPRPVRGALLYDRKEKGVDIKEAMKIVAEQVIVKGDERIEEALQTVEAALSLKPIVSHGNGESFHYIDREDV